MNAIVRKLQGGDLRSIGRANEVVAQVLKSPELMGDLFEGLFHKEPVVRARTADSLEKICVKQPNLLRPFRARILSEVSPIDQKEVRWHVAQILGRVALTTKQRDKAVKVLRDYMHMNDSQIVRVCALQALTDLARKDTTLQSEVNRLVEDSLHDQSPSIRARARKIQSENRPSKKYDCD